VPTVATRESAGAGTVIDEDQIGELTAGLRSGLDALA
jgi:hypothetical protein